jgi:restriction system protein
MTDDYAHIMKPWHQVIASPLGTSQIAIPETLEFQSLYTERPMLEVEALVVSAHRMAGATLTKELLGRIYAQNFTFFETMIIDLLLAMGYGARRRDMSQRLGRSGDGGVDGVIDQDELGLDVIYFQAKRLKPGVAVPISAVRDFAGSLESFRASKGIFVTTAHFSAAAYDFVQQVTRRIILIDGSKLTDLMVRHNIGVRVKESYQFKRIDGDYFLQSSIRE